MPGRRRSIATACACLGLVAIAILGGSMRDDGVAHHIRLPAVGVLALLALIVLCIFCGVAVVGSLRGGPPGSPRERSFVAQLVAVIVIIVVIGAFSILVRRLRNDLAAEPTSPPATAAADGHASHGTISAGAADTVGSVVGVLVLALGCLLILGRRRDRGPIGSEPDGPSSVAAELSDVFDGAIADLRSESDPRRAVIDAYDRAERSLSRHGLARAPAEAPLEYLERVLPALDASGAAIAGLTHLFERAMFSSHAIDAAMQQEAIEALVVIRDELRARPTAGRVA